MDDKILEFMSKENVRLASGNKWLVVDKIETCYELTVIEHTYRQRGITYLYDGHSIDDALQALKMEITKREAETILRLYYYRQYRVGGADKLRQKVLKNFPFLSGLDERLSTE